MILLRETKARLEIRLSLEVGAEMSGLNNGRARKP
jgi:hypothetical protein